MAIVGYKLGEDRQKNPQIPLKGNRIMRFYIHDDNIGPFARFDFQINTDGALIFNRKEYHFKTENGEDKQSEIKARGIVIPLYKKIRYPFSKLLPYLNVFLEFLNISNIFGMNSEADLFEWDSYLISLNDLKTAMIKSEIPIPSFERQKMLLGYFPRFIWRNILLFNDFPILEILGDATEGQNSLPFFAIFFYSENFAKRLKEAFNDTQVKNSLSEYYCIAGINEFCAFLEKEINKY